MSKDKNDKYKRKFLVEGSSLTSCVDICKIKEDSFFYPGDYRPLNLSCLVVFNTYNNNTSSYVIKTSKCMYPERLHKPHKYIVSETKDGKWLCSCPRGKFRRVNGESQCDHVNTAKSDPEKYEVPVHVTGTLVEIADTI